MNLLNKIVAFFTFISLCTLSYESFAQCSYPEWTPCFPLPGCTWVTGDIASYDGKDWQLGSTAQGYREPGSLTGAAFWVEISNPCASPSGPTVAATEVRANYCTTSFAVGTITSDEGSAIIKRGFVFGTSTGPTIEYSDVLQDARTGTGDEFEGLMENLTPETDYYVRTYAINSIDTTYGTEATFTTLATSDCVTDCDLACDMTDPGLLNPSVIELNSTYSIIGIDDTLCITEDRSYSGSTVRGMLKLCNGAQLTISGSMTVQRSESNPLLGGQIVYEGCNENILGIGSYSGSLISGSLDDADPKQMISYCGTCNENDTSQFLNVESQIDHWGATCRPTTTLLPVELTHFEVSKIEEGMLLEWTTASEIENSHFEVEISYNGTNWSSIGVVQGAGNSMEENNYSFIDNEIGSGVQYYRLKQVDFDGTEYSSNIKHFSFDETEELKMFIAFQNETNKIEVQAKFNGMGEAFLMDTRGKIVEIKSFISANKAGTKIIFDSNNLSESIYFVQIKSGNALLGQKVQVIH
jgi:hypothetical protein